VPSPGPRVEGGKWEEGVARNGVSDNTKHRRGVTENEISKKEKSKDINEDGKAVRN